jgi:putative transposase
MPRRPRIYIEDMSQHVFHRGINCSAIVLDDEDHEYLLQFIARAADRHGVSVHAFAVMTTHYHLVVTPVGEGVLAKFMQEIGIRYTRYFNRKYDRIGTVWNDRYGAALLDNERYWFNCLRYVELNPLNAHMVAAAELYRWSSYRVHALGEPSGWLTLHPLYLALGPTPGVRQAAYRSMCAIPLTFDEENLLRHPPATAQLSAEMRI